MFSADKPKDPVCGMDVDIHTKLNTKHNGVVYYFCSPHCLEKFKKESQLYLDKKESEPASCDSCDIGHDGAGVYTCPMHPEIVQDHPGSCPKCGMALEPMKATQNGDDTELNEMKKRFLFSAAFAVPLLLLSMGDMLPGKPISHIFSTPIRIYR